MAQLDRHTVLRLAPTCRLHWEESRQYCLLLYPAGAVPLNRRTAEVLSRCDGQQRVDEIIQALARAYPASGLEGEVVQLLRDALDRGTGYRQPRRAGHQARRTPFRPVPCGRG